MVNRRWTLNLMFWYNYFCLSGYEMFLAVEWGKLEAAAVVCCAGFETLGAMLRLWGSS